MKDRFRFRVWNKKNKEMIYNAEIAYDGMNYNTSWKIGNNTNDGWVDCFGYYLDYPEDYEVMQCAGLKDKNGKLIYEGDIVTDGIENYVVVWIDDDDHLGFYVRDLENVHHTFYQLLSYEVIGNIYENKDLLNENS